MDSARSPNAAKKYKKASSSPSYRKRTNSGSNSNSPLTREAKAKYAQGVYQARTVLASTQQSMQQIARIPKPISPSRAP